MYWHGNPQRAPSPPEFAQPGLSRSNGNHPQRERVQIWVCLFLCGWSYPSLPLQIWVCLICVISTYSNGAVQIQVGLELAEIIPELSGTKIASQNRSDHGGRKRFATIPLQKSQGFSLHRLQKIASR